MDSLGLNETRIGELRYFRGSTYIDFSLWSFFFLFGMGYWIINFGEIKKYTCMGILSDSLLYYRGGNDPWYFHKGVDFESYDILKVLESLTSILNNSETGWKVRIGKRKELFEDGIGASLLANSSRIYYTWNPNDPCFDWKRPSFGGWGRTGSRYICARVYTPIVPGVWGMVINPLEVVFVNIIRIPYDSWVDHPPNLRYFFDHGTYGGGYVEVSFSTMSFSFLNSKSLLRNAEEKMKISPASVGKKYRTGIHWTTPNGPWFHKMSIQLIPSDMFNCDWSGLWFHRRHIFLQVILHGIGAKASLKASRFFFSVGRNFDTEKGSTSSWLKFGVLVSSKKRSGMCFFPTFWADRLLFLNFWRITGQLCSAPSYLFRCLTTSKLQIAFSVVAFCFSRWSQVIFWIRQPILAEYDV